MRNSMSCILWFQRLRNRRWLYHPTKKQEESRKWKCMLFSSWVNNLFEVYYKLEIAFKLEPGKGWYLWKLGYICTAPPKPEVVSIVIKTWVCWQLFAGWTQWVCKFFRFVIHHIWRNLWFMPVRILLNAWSDLTLAHSLVPVCYYP